MRLGREGGFGFAVGEEAVVCNVRDVHWWHTLEFALEVVTEHAEASSPEDALAAAFLNRIPFTATLERAIYGVWIFVGPVG